MKASKIFKDVQLCASITDKLEKDVAQGIISTDEVLEVLKKVNRYLDIIEKDVENM